MFDLSGITFVKVNLVMKAPSYAVAVPGCQTGLPTEGCLDTWRRGRQRDSADCGQDAGRDQTGRRGGRTDYEQQSEDKYFYIFYRFAKTMPKN